MTTKWIGYKQYDEYDENGFQTVFTIATTGDGRAPETRAERLLRWEGYGSYDPDCLTCRNIPAHKTLSPFQPGHKASSRCRSGSRPHCICDTCF